MVVRGNINIVCEIGDLLHVVFETKLYNDTVYGYLMIAYKHVFMFNNFSSTYNRTCSAGLITIENVNRVCAYLYL